MKAIKAVMLAAAAAAPLALAGTSAHAVTEPQGYTCDATTLSGTNGQGSGNCVASGGKPDSGQITGLFFIVKRSDDTSLTCEPKDGVNSTGPSGTASTPDSVLGDNCFKTV